MLLVQKLAVFIEHLPAAVAAIAHAHTVADGIDRDAVCTRSYSRDATSPADSIRVEFRDARAVVAAGHEQRAAGQPGEKPRTVEMFVVGAAHTWP